ncbi:MAG: Deoxycytidine triphosphate deaminase [Candidatus Jorgensenbacteria bacterium GW2011_GWA1_48_13]|uniref:dCTP deaminase n=2 Tax=Candidatus Joergenseniibacteriota TaxID=1752739 RepID=A0A0G1Z7R3_9BACT|nr:MAG: Deoxycytidine triphosphate deaminase [Candidatus Jorgensenbacteria bacterium GW2011_GWA1_48_13]KKU99334.1 MAG: hypothetical protein UY32_C0002G0070 [Candidatus Jorgensenbacteria bacterium GW2011_GWC1_48_8]KKW15019.1 MAG: Deoxycytidine triphosphate deaminase [Candidatus Jorgensenbacteria bacterium GW2011_GWB1_50_10]
MVLSDKDIKKYIQEGKINISPAPDFEKQLGSCSLDLHLGEIFKIFKSSQYPYLDLKQNVNFEGLMEEVRVDKEGGAFVLQPKGFVLAVTKESFELPDDIMGRLDGRSSLGRLGVVVHSTAARFDPGWKGKAVMELGNLGIMPVVLYSGMRICALTFEMLSSPSEVPYGKGKDSKYLSQEGPQATKVDEELRG